MANKTFDAEARVVSVVDGDTVHTFLDVGWGIILSPRLGKRAGFGTIRLVYAGGARWDSPERKDRTRWEAARGALSAFLLPGLFYPVVSYGIDDFGRTLGAITLHNGEDVASLLAELGHAK
jgi:endonuclease YncB( thermonuclease family)